MRFVNVTVIDDDRLERRFEAFEVSLSNVQVRAGASIGRIASHPKLGAGMSVCGYAGMRVCWSGFVFDRGFPKIAKLRFVCF